MQRWIKFFAFLIALSLTISLFGCNSTNGDTGKERVAIKGDVKQQYEKTVEKKVDGLVEQKPVEDQDAETTSNSDQNKKDEQEQRSDNTGETPAGQDTGPTKQNTNKGTAINTETNKSAVPAKSPEPQKSTAPAKKTETSDSAVPQTTKPKGTTNTGNGATEKTPEPATTVSLTIKGPKEHGTILANSKVSVKDGETILTVLLREAKSKKIHVDYRGSGSTVYVQGIEDDGGKWSFYEFDLSATSGWVFELNGVSLTQSIGMKEIKDGDRIECIYTE